MNSKFIDKTHTVGGGILSSTITLLRFPMAVLIVFHHSSFELELKNGVSIFEGLEAPFYHHLDYMSVRNITMIAVPLFFLISGFLFFFKEKEFTIEIYINKLKKRIKSLFMPYIIWNILVLLLYFVVQNLAPTMNSGRTKLVTEFDFSDLLCCFWSMKDLNGQATPIDGPLWFIRDLMIIMLLSPIVYWLIKKLKFFVPMVFLALYISGAVPTIGGLSIAVCTFFSIGAYFGIYKIDFVKQTMKFVRYSSFLYVGLLLVIVSMMDMSLPSYIIMAEIVIGVFTSIGVAGKMIQSGCVPNKFLAGSTFFLFASHSEVLKIFVRLCSQFGPSSEVFYCIAYLICPLIACMLLLLVYKTLNFFMPKVAAVLSGGR